MMLEGKHRCRYCGKEIDWFYQVPQTMGSPRFDIDTIPADKIRLHSVGKTVEQNGYSMPLDASIYCPKCNKLNHIEV